MTIGNLIALLKARNPDQDVVFDFGGFIPRDVDSYRGYYDQLALGYDDDYTKETTVSALIARLEAAIGKTFHGYKGGDYRMDEDTKLWVANYGECHSTAILGLADCDWHTVIATGFREW